MPSNHFLEESCSGDCITFPLYAVKSYFIAFITSPFAPKATYATGNGTTTHACTHAHMHAQPMYINMKWMHFQKMLLFFGLAVKASNWLKDFREKEWRKLRRKKKRPIVHFHMWKMENKPLVESLSSPCGRSGSRERGEKQQLSPYANSSLQTLRECNKSSLLNCDQEQNLHFFFFLRQFRAFEVFGETYTAGIWMISFSVHFFLSILYLKCCDTSVCNQWYKTHQILISWAEQQDRLLWKFSHQLWKSAKESGKAKRLTCFFVPFVRFFFFPHADTINWQQQIVKVWLGAYEVKKKRKKKRVKLKKINPIQQTSPTLIQS